jgi:hypothetical protein
MNLKSHEFEIILVFYYSHLYTKHLLTKCFFNTFKIEHVFYYSNFHQAFSNLLCFNIFHKKWVHVFII